MEVVARSKLRADALTFLSQCLFPIYKAESATHPTVRFNWDKTYMNKYETQSKLSLRSVLTTISPVLSSLHNVTMFSNHSFS